MTLPIPCEVQDGANIDKESLFVIVDSSCISRPSSREILVEDKEDTDTDRKRVDLNTTEVASTSKDNGVQVPLRPKNSCDYTDELEIVDINLQSDNELLVEGNDELENESIVITYLRNKGAFSDIENTMQSVKKKYSLLQNVPRMETILEGEQFNLFNTASKDELSLNIFQPDPKDNS